MSQAARADGKRKPFVRRVQQALRKRWVQVCNIALVWLLAGLVTPAFLGPKAITKSATVEYKFMHCDACKFELPYNKDIAFKRCAKCRPPTVGFMTPTEDSVKGSKAMLSPWGKVYAAWFVETVIMLAAVVYVLYLPVADLTKVFYVLVCPHCAQRLRYRAVSLGGIGSCSRCKRMIRFPEEDDAVLEEDLLRAEAEAARAEHEAMREQMEAEPR